MREVKPVFQQFCRQLAAVYPEREARHIAHMVFEQVAGLSRLDLITKTNQRLTDSQQQDLTGKLNRLLRHEPVQYVLKECVFYHLPLYVNEHVLIPRPETEELVEWIIRTCRPRIKSGGKDSPVILDAGTGSGCIAIALKKNLPDTVVMAVDKSTLALQVAERNSIDNGTEITFIHADLLENDWFSSLPPLSVLVSNPPYIPRSARAVMPKNVVNFEPDMALFVPDDDPLIFYKALLSCAREKLAEDGAIFLEIHEELGEEVIALLRMNGFGYELKKDLSGRDRMIRAVRIS